MKNKAGNEIQLNGGTFIEILQRIELNKMKWNPRKQIRRIMNWTNWMLMKWSEIQIAAIKLASRNQTNKSNKLHLMIEDIQSVN